jgi:hypothetical protein
MPTIYDQLVTAWESDDPLALDHAAERLAAAGVTESSILEGLIQLLLATRANGADDETEERIHEVMDRLTGWCLASNRIRARRPTAPVDDRANIPVDSVPPEAPPWSLPK